MLDSSLYSSFLYISFIQPILGFITSRNQCPPQPYEEWLCVLYEYITAWEHKIVPTEDMWMC